MSSPEAQSSRANEGDTMRKALKFLTLIKEHKCVEALDIGNATIKLLTSPKNLEEAFADVQKRCGAMESFDPVQVDQFGQNAAAKVLVKFEKEESLAIIAFDTAGLISGFNIVPTKEPSSTWEQPVYTNSDLFTEKDVTLVVDEFNVGATISLPKSKPIAGVVLLVGLGLSDRDSKMGQNKPLKDIAWGLASNDIAVCRWDKQGGKDSGGLIQTETTLQEEYLSYSLAVIKQFHEELESAEYSDIPIFVLGHSQGGRVAPIIAAADHSVKGLVMMSVGAGKLYHSAWRQLHYLKSLNHDPPFVIQEHIDLTAKQIAAIEDPGFSATSHGEELLFGAPASYWLSIKEYDQVAAAAALDIPLLLLQPGRDYQMTVEDDFEPWKRGLSGKENASMKVYPELNFIFLRRPQPAGDEPSTPNDHRWEGHVDEKVIEDLCAWFKEHSSSNVEVPA